MSRQQDTDRLPSPLQGGCLCGAVRYRIHRLRSAYWCHCTMCRRSSGSSALPWATVERGDFEITQGTPAAYPSSPGVARRFCARCGSPLVFDMAVEDALDVTLGTLDTPDEVCPTFHIWTTTALAMSEGLGASLAHYAAERPEDAPPPQE